MDSAKNVLVCVTQQKNCERLIHKASELNEKYNGELFIIHVAKNDWNFLDNHKEGEALQYLFNISKSVGANLSVLKSDNIVKTIANFVNENKIGCIVMGESQSIHKENNFYYQLKSLIKDIEIQVIP